MSSGKVTFGTLSREEIDGLLERNHVGRVAFAKGNRVEIIPVHYVFTPEWIYGRTTPGGVIHNVAEPWWPVAFEVDEVDDLFDWRSVVIHGGLYLVPKDGAAWQREAWKEGIEKLRKLVPTALKDEDPVPERSSIFRIAIQEVAGKVASTA